MLIDALLDHAATQPDGVALLSSAVNAMNAALGNKSDSPDEVARFITESLTQERLRARIGRMERIFVLINAVFPTLVDRALIKKLPVINRFLQSDASGEMK